MSFYKVSIGKIGSGYVESIKENDELINETTLYMLRGYCFSNTEVFFISHFYLPPACKKLNPNSYCHF